MQPTIKPVIKPNIVPVQPVKSSGIQAIGYDASKGILAVQFKGGKIYNYEGVGQETVNNLNKAESIGGFVSKNVVGKFKLYEEKK